jgi:hypothetical protein
MDEQPKSKKREIIAALAVLIVIVAIVGAASASNKKKGDLAATSTATTSSTPGSAESATSPASTSSSANNSGSNSVATASAYKDGEYMATGSYDSPGGTESITVDVTLKNGVVTATSATSGATDNDAEEYQSQFISGYKSLIVGRDVNSVGLSRVSGSSLTSQGFNSALEQIKQQAR